MTFDALISRRYQLPLFPCGPLEFYSVGVTEPPGDYWELRTAILRDSRMVSILWKHGFLPFARPEDSSHDPVCFDCGNARSNEPAVVRIDHEEILRRDRVRVA